MSQEPIRPEDQDPKHWRASGWAARIIKNEDDDGWAVEMTAEGESEPALVGPWTMGRDKKNPKPIDVNGFAVLVKAANETRARTLQQRRAQLHRSVTVEAADGRRLQVELDVVPDDDDPHAIVTVLDRDGVVVSKSRVDAGFKLSSATAQRWVDGGARESS